VPHWPDLAQPLKVVWFCRAHRTVERERLAEAAAAITKVVAWKTLGERFARCARSLITVGCCGL
jgi:hypothetical protein